MSKTPITAIQKSKTIDYSNKTVNDFWLINKKARAVADRQNFEKIVSQIKDVKDSVICIQTELLDCPVLIEEIELAIERKNRIYILTNVKNDKLESISGACLIRYGINNSGSFILVNPGSDKPKGALFTSLFIETAFDNKKNVAIELNKIQTEVLYRFFSNKFWNDATHEIIEDFNNPQIVGEAPFDVLPNRNDFCDEVYINKYINRNDNASFISVPKIAKTNIIDTSKYDTDFVFTELLGNDSKELKKLADKGTKIYADDFNSLQVVLGEDSKSFLFPKTNISDNDIIYGLELDINQKQLLAKYLKDEVDGNKYQYIISRSREELVLEKVLFQNDLKTQIEFINNNNINLGSIESEKFIKKSELENVEPKFDDDNISAQIKYEWKVLPFYTPTKAKVAKLYKDWDNKTTEFKKKLEDINKSIEGSKEKEKNMAGLLKRFFLGNNQAVNEYKIELEKLSKIELSTLIYSDRKAIIERINSLYKAVTDNSKIIDVEIRKNKKEEEKEILKEELANKKQELESLIKETEEKRKKAEKEKEEKLFEFMIEHELEEDKIESFVSELEEKSGKKNKKKNPNEASKAEKTLNEYKVIGRAYFSGKNESDIKKLEKENKSLESSIQRKEAEIKKIKPEEEKKGSSLNNVVRNNSEKQNNKAMQLFDVSKEMEFLPKTGNLKEAGKTKYLEIVYWEEHENALKEASRLGAKLSVINN